MDGFVHDDDRELLHLSEELLSGVKGCIDASIKDSLSELVITSCLKLHKLYRRSYLTLRNVIVPLQLCEGPL